MQEEKKRLFFGFSVEAPWLEKYPKGRIIEPPYRHITTAFLGNIGYQELFNRLPTIPHPPFDLGPAGWVNELLFLPHKEKRVTAYHIEWLTKEGEIKTFHQDLQTWVEQQGYPIDKRPFLSHLSIARAPFDQPEWEKSFEPFPLYLSGFHLYESIGNLRYEPLWSLFFQPPFEEIEHTADIGFHIYGRSYAELYVHAALALSFKYPSFIRFLSKERPKDLNTAVRMLNQMLSSCDLERGCPFKAISYHGEVKEGDILRWEMIVDV